MSKDEVVDFRFLNDDSDFVVATKTALTIRASDTRALVTTIPAPSGHEFRGVATSGDGRHMVAFTDKTLLMVNCLDWTWADVTPDAFATLWDGIPESNLSAFAIVGGIHGVASSDDGSFVYAITHDEAGISARRVDVTNRTVTNVLTSTMPSNYYRGSWAKLLTTTQLVVLNYGSQLRSGWNPSAAIWNPVITDPPTQIDLVGSSSQELSGNRLAALLCDQSCRFIVSDLESINSVLGGLHATTELLVDIKNSDGTPNDDASDVIELNDGRFIVNDLNPITEQGARYKSPIRELNIDTTRLGKPLTNLSIMAQHFRLDAGSSVIIAYGYDGAQAITVQSAVAVPTNLSVGNVGHGVSELTWSLVNLNAKLNVVDYVIQRRTFTVPKPIVVKDGKSKSRFLDMTDIDSSSEFRVKALYKDGSVSAWSSWVGLN
jgi:hypothetical protein